MEDREIRGLAILSKGDTPIAVSEKEWFVPSQSGAGKYRVQQADLWACECPDFKTRKVECKHIKAIQFWLKMKNKLELSELDIEKELDKPECPYCNSPQITKNGSRKTTTGERQRFKCSACGKRFVLEPIKHTKANAKIITLAMDLYFKGLSLRDISDTIFQFYGLRIHFDTIRRWISKFSKAMNDYTAQFKPKVSGIMHTGEQMIKSKGKWVWAWNSMDKGTRFLLASTITKKKEVGDARKHFKEVKEALGEQKPALVITDGLGAYNKAINKEFITNTGETKHINIKHRRHLINNNLIENYHGQFREFDKVRRGFKSNKTTQEWANGFKLYHNYIKQQQGLGGITPSQKAEIELNLDRNRWLSLLQKSAEKCP